MSPVLPALALVLCLAMGVWGFVLVRGAPAALLEPARPRPTGSGGRGGPITRLLGALNQRLEQPVLGLLGEGRRKLTAHRLDAAGRPGGMTLSRFAGRKGTWTLLGTVAGLLMSALSGNLLFAIAFAVLGWLWLDLWLVRRARARQDRIDRDLPDFLDVLAVSVSAGIGFRPALERVAEGVGGPVAEEVLTSLRQMQLGSTRREAFEALRERNDSEFVGQFVTAMLQAEELGVPLGDALRDLAKDMRRGAFQRARQRAQRAAPRVSVIVTTLLVPGAILLILVSLFLSSEADLGAIFGG